MGRKVPVAQPGVFVDMRQSVCGYAPECVVTKHLPDPGLDLDLPRGETEPKPLAAKGSQAKASG